MPYCDPNPPPYPGGGGLYARRRATFAALELFAADAAAARPEADHAAADHASRLARAIALDDDDDTDDDARDANIVDPRAVRTSIARARAKDVPADVDARDAHPDAPIAVVTAFARVTALDTPRKTNNDIPVVSTRALSLSRSRARRNLTFFSISSLQLFANYLFEIHPPRARVGRRARRSEKLFTRSSVSLVVRILRRERARRSVSRSVRDGGGVSVEGCASSRRLSRVSRARTARESRDETKRETRRVARRIASRHARNLSPRRGR